VGERCDEGSQSLGQRCRAVVIRLAALYDWRLDQLGREGLISAVEEAHSAGDAPTTRALEQTCCRLRFAQLFAGLEAGGARADAAFGELFTVRWPSDGVEAQVGYGGYLFRSALATIRRRLAGSTVVVAEYDQMAADAASRAVTTVRNRFRDCRDPDAFWGWLARVAEHAAIDELRSGQVTGGRSLHAASLDAVQEAYGDRGFAAPSVDEYDERQVDAIAVREELLRKCRLGKLSDDQRESLVRSFWGGEKPQEIAVSLTDERGQPVTAAQVSLWKHRGLQVMESNLRGRGYQ
jgi:DNA-directed RNA polymerase specialized sigma24 family protein